MKKIEQNECFAISSNLFPCVCVGTYWTALSPSETEENMQGTCEDFEYFSLDWEEWKDGIVMAAADFIENEVCPIMKKYGLENIMVEKMYSPKEYNFTDDCLYFTVEMSADWREKMHNYLNDFRKDKKFQKYIEEHWYSRDGFWSWMPQSFEEIERMNDEERCVGAYLTLCLLNEDKMNLFDDSVEYIYYKLNEGSYGNYFKITEDYLGDEEGKKIESLYNDDNRMNELYHDLLNKIGEQWKGCDRISGKSDEYMSLRAKNEAMRLIFWALENGYTVSDLEAMAA